MSDNVNNKNNELKNVFEKVAIVNQWKDPVNGDVNFNLTNSTKIITVSETVKQMLLNEFIENIKY